MTVAGASWPNTRATARRGLSGHDPVAELQCQLVNLLNAVNRLDYDTASVLASKVRTLMALAHEHVSRLPADLERAAMAARLSAVTCAAARVLHVAPRAPPGASRRSNRKDQERSWIRERKRGDPVLLSYDQGTLI